MGGSQSGLGPGGEPLPQRHAAERAVDFNKPRREGTQLISQIPQTVCQYLWYKTDTLFYLPQSSIQFSSSSETSFPVDQTISNDQHLHKIRCATWSFTRCLANRVSGPEDEMALQRALLTRLDASSANRLLRAPNRPLQALADLGRAMNALPVDEKRRVEMDKSVILLGDALETCERIFTSPVPLVYTRHTARFLSCWLLLLPLALWEPFGSSWNHLAVVPASTLVAIFFFGIEELAVQLEEPFSILPLSKLCDNVWDGGVELYQEQWDGNSALGTSSPITENAAAEFVESVRL